MRLKDRVAIVTGGGTGIGRAIATTLAAEGATVVVASRTLSALEEAVREIESRGGKAKAIPTDVADEKQIQRLVAQTLEAFGGIDILVNNSAAMAGGLVPVTEMTLPFWNESLTVNLTGTMLCSREVLKDMIPRRSGSIINISSIGGVTGNPFRSPYSASKFGIIGFTQTLAIEVGEHNIRVNALAPAATHSDRFESGIRAKAKSLGVPYEELMAKILRSYSMKRLVKPSEVATAALFLASDDASAITGQTLIVSCGFHPLHPSEIT